jgi:uncharacterized membrane protein
MSKHKKHHNHPHHTRDHSHREQFEPGPSRRGRVSPTVLVLAVSGVLFGALVYVIGSRGQASSQEIATEVGGTGGDVSLPVATFADGAARFYRYTTAAGREVKFFVMKSSDGVVRAAFDACDTCYRERKGYHQQGDVMVCRNCGRTFRSVDINVLQGGCNPAPLERAIAGDQLVLKATSIELGAMYF